MTHAKSIAHGAAGGGKGGKGARWATVARPGAHSKKDSIPLTTLVRDVLGLAGNAREARKILSQGSVLVDGRKVCDAKAAVGLMDVVEVPKIKKTFRILPGPKGVYPLEIDSKEAKLKPCRVVGKNNVAGGKTQLALHDGGTMLSDDATVKVNDTLVLTLPERKVSQKIAFAKGAVAMIAHGRHSGKVDKIKDVLPGMASRKSLTTLGELQTLTDYLFVLGDKEPVVKTE